MTEQIKSVVAHTSSIYDTAEGSECGSSIYGDWDEDLFTQDDLRGELGRLKEGISGERGLNASHSFHQTTEAVPGMLCPLPDAMQPAPVGFRVTKEMENIREMLLLGSDDDNIITVVGMGGSGKTVATSWVCRPVTTLFPFTYRMCSKIPHPIRATRPLLRLC